MLSSCDFQAETLKLLDQICVADAEATAKSTKDRDGDGTGLMHAVAAETAVEAAVASAVKRSQPAVNLPQKDMGASVVSKSVKSCEINLTSATDGTAAIERANVSQDRLQSLSNPWISCTNGAHADGPSSVAPRRSRRLVIPAVVPSIGAEIEGDSSPLSLVDKANGSSRSPPWDRQQFERAQTKASDVNKESIESKVEEKREVQQHKRPKGHSAAALVQEDLVARAFVTGSHHQADFAAEKNRAIDRIANASAEVPLTAALSGWGSWGGTGVRGQAKRERERDANIVVARMKARKKAADKMGSSKLAQVLLNERKAKGAEKFQAQTVPFEFTNSSKSVYESSLRAGLGPEFNTSRGFKAKIQPGVSTRLGAVVAPIRKRQGRKLVPKRRPLR